MREKSMRKWFLLALFGFSTFNLAGADELYIRNKPFKGSIQGVGHDASHLRVDAGPAVEAMGLTVTEIEGNWVVAKGGQVPALPAGVKGKGKLYVGGKELPFVADGRIRYVVLQDLGKLLGARFVYNKDTGILDVSMTGQSTPDNWGGASASYRLVYFGTDKAPACRHFHPLLAQFEKDSKIPVVWIDTEKPTANLYKNYIKYFEGTQIPHTVLVNSGGKAVKRWTGSIPLGKFSAEVRSLTRK